MSWFYRCLVEGFFGVKGDRHGLVIQPQLPSHWSQVKITREFRGATFRIAMRREAGSAQITVTVDGQAVSSNRVTSIQAGRTYHVEVSVPAQSLSGKGV